MTGLLGAASSAADKRAAFRAGLNSGRLQRFPGAFSPLVAKLVAEIGFEGVYVSGAVLSADLDRSRARAAEFEPRLRAAMARFIERNHAALDNFAGRLATHSERHESLLARGYVVVRNGVARVLTEAAEISAGDPLDLEFHDGRVGVVAGSRPRPRTRRTGVHPGQGSLF